MSTNIPEYNIAYAKFLKTIEKWTKSFRMIFVLLGIGYVLYSFSRTIQKYREGNVLVKQENKYFEKYRYPSVTFCYKFKHGSKDVMNNYYPSLYKKWQATGISIWTESSYTK